jgi:hypothetical protein
MVVGIGFLEVQQPQAREISDIDGPEWVQMG